jgi:hypothetical protein
MAMFAAMLGVSKVVWAAALLQTPVVFTNGTDRIYCIATNVGTTPLTSVTVSNVDQTNTTVNTFTCPSVAPGSFCDAFTTTTSSRCTISFKGSKKNIRGLVTVVDAANNMKATIPAN